MSLHIAIRLPVKRVYLTVFCCNTLRVRRRWVTWKSHLWRSGESFRASCLRPYKLSNVIMKNIKGDCSFVCSGSKRQSLTACQIYADNSAIRSLLNTFGRRRSACILRFLPLMVSAICDYSKPKRPSFQAVGPPFHVPAPLTD